MNKWKVFLIFIGVLFLSVSNLFVAASAEQQQSVEVEGKLEIIWGDPMPGSNQDTLTRYYLTDDSGNQIELNVDVDTVGWENHLVWQNQKVWVSGQQSSQDDTLAVTVDEISPAEMHIQSLTDVVGSQPWISIMCKFSDQSAEPENLAYFQGMYANVYPGLDHYWREQSYDQINLVGSGAAGWFVLPHPESYYNPSDTLGGADLDKLLNDCVGVADPSINFAPYAGINMMFNTDFDNGYAWGGYRSFSLDGVYKRWRLTWEPPWGYQNISVIAHETGHGFGLPHSTYNPNTVYDNYWDVMSYTWGNNLYHSVYGNVGQHTISYHKDILGWIDTGEKFIPSQDTRTTITLERLALPQTSNYRMAQIPIGGSSTHFYTVEARRTVGYDAALPGNAVIIHEVNTYLDEPAHVIDIDGNGITNDAGTQWVVGETFADVSNQISVSVDAITSSGYVITIQLGNPTTPPEDFAKLSPANGAVNQLTNRTLTWESSMGANSYEYCYDTTNDNACSNWISVGNNTSAWVTNLNTSTIYYWHVRAINSIGTTYADGSTSAYWTLTTADTIYDVSLPILKR
jgi:M6 family metalloprotease-like protein